MILTTTLLAYAVTRDVILLRCFAVLAVACAVLIVGELVQNKAVLTWSFRSPRGPGLGDYSEVRRLIRESRPPRLGPVDGHDLAARAMRNRS